MDFLINDLGIPTVQYGPGDGELCHTDRERLDIRQLETAVSVYHSIINMTCGRVNNGYSWYTCLDYSDQDALHTVLQQFDVGRSDEA